MSMTIGPVTIREENCSRPDELGSIEMEVAWLKISAGSLSMDMKVLENPVFRIPSTNFTAL